MSGRSGGGSQRPWPQTPSSRRNALGSRARRRAGVTRRCRRCAAARPPCAFELGLFPIQWGLRLTAFVPRSIADFDRAAPGRVRGARVHHRVRDEARGDGRAARRDPIVRGVRLGAASAGRRRGRGDGGPGGEAWRAVHAHPQRCGAAIACARSRRPRSRRLLCLRLVAENPLPALAWGGADPADLQGGVSLRAEEDGFWQVRVILSADKALGACLAIGAGIYGLQR